MANLVQPSMRKGAKMSLSNNLSSHILKISTDRDHTTSLGRLFPGMAVLTLKKFLSYIKMIPLLVQLVALAFSMWILGKKEPSSSFSPRFYYWNSLMRSQLRFLFSIEKLLQFFFTAPIVHPFDGLHGPPFDPLQSGHVFLGF